MILAVTGHRDIVMDEKLKKEVDTVFSEVLKKHKHITLLSALAEGADQFVVACSLGYEHITFEVPLPLSQNEYIQTFNSTTNFLTLLKEASHTFEIPPIYEHPYENLGHYLIENSDVLLALWDGTHNAKQGGTAEVVSYAKSKNHKVIHIPVKRQNP